MNQRECGECQLCCELLSVRERGHLEKSGLPYEFDKPPQTRCEQQCAAGCAIYNKEILPISCRAFECEWLAGAFHDEARPDLCGIVVSLRKGKTDPTENWAIVYGVGIVEDEQGQHLELSSRQRRVLGQLMAKGSGIDVIEFHPRGEGMGPGRTWGLKRRPGIGWEAIVVSFPPERPWVDGDLERAVAQEIAGPGPLPHRMRRLMMDLPEAKMERLAAQLRKARGT